MKNVGTGTEHSYEAQLAGFIGRRLSSPAPGPDPVNVPMIRHWVEAMGLTNPVHLDARAAQETGRSDIVAPVSMIQAWTMRGYARTTHPTATVGDFQSLIDLLAEGGYTSVVATDSDFEFVREVHPGEEILTDESVEDISAEKKTGLGTGRFVTTTKTYRARPVNTEDDGEVVAIQRWRTLRFRPGEPAAAEETAQSRTTVGNSMAEGQRPLRPRPAVNLDNQFWFEAAEERRLLIQRCTDCHELRHPPGPQCPHCQSFSWDTVEASGRGHLFSFTIAHHPKHPAFDYPLVVAVVELEERTRLITNLTGIEPARVEIGMPLILDWLTVDPELTLPVFRPVSDAMPPEEN